MAARAVESSAPHSASEMPCFSRVAASAISATSVFVALAALHVSDCSSDRSLRRCMPMHSGSEPPAAAQLPSPYVASWRRFQPTSSLRRWRKIFSSISFAICFAVPPAVSVAPRGTRLTGVDEPCSTICMLLDSSPSPHFVDSSQPKLRMRAQPATRNAAMHSPAIVTSPRIFCSCRSHGCGTTALGA